MEITAVVGAIRSIPDGAGPSRSLQRRASHNPKGRTPVPSSCKQVLFIPVLLHWQELEIDGVWEALTTSPGLLFAILCWISVLSSLGDNYASSQWCLVFGKQRS